MKNVPLVMTGVKVDPQSTLWQMVESLMVVLYSFQSEGKSFCLTAFVHKEFDPSSMSTT
jgi:hypothetical protein